MMVYENVDEGKAKKIYFSDDTTTVEAILESDLRAGTDKWITVVSGNSDYIFRNSQIYCFRIIRELSVEALETRLQKLSDNFYTPALIGFAVDRNKFKVGQLVRVTIEEVVDEDSIVKPSCKADVLTDNKYLLNQSSQQIVRHNG